MLFRSVIGDEVEVEATVYKEGHDLVAARIRYRRAGDRGTRTAPMGYDRNLDRCRGSFPVDRVGRWSFAVEAWTDRFATWREDLEAKADAGQDTHSDLLEVAVMVDGAAGAAPVEARAALRQIATALRDPGRPSLERAKIALGDELRTLMERHWEPDDVTA